MVDSPESITDYYSLLSGNIPKCQLSDDYLSSASRKVLLVGLVLPFYSVIITYFLVVCGRLRAPCKFYPDPYPNPLPPQLLVLRRGT